MSPRGKYSETMKKWPGIVQAPMNKHIFGWKMVDMIATSFLKVASVFSSAKEGGVSETGGGKIAKRECCLPVMGLCNILMATSLPLHFPL